MKYRNFTLLFAQQYYVIISAESSLFPEQHRKWNIYTMQKITQKFVMQSKIMWKKHELQNLHLVVNLFHACFFLINFFVCGEAQLIRCHDTNKIAFCQRVVLKWNNWEWKYFFNKGYFYKILSIIRVINKLP